MTRDEVKKEGTIRERREGRKEGKKKREEKKKKNMCVHSEHDSYFAGPLLL